MNLPNLPLPVYCVLYLDCVEVLLQLHTGDIKVFWVLRTSSLKPYHIHERSVSHCTLASVHTFVNIQQWLKLLSLPCTTAAAARCKKRCLLSLTGPRLHTCMLLFVNHIFKIIFPPPITSIASSCYFQPFNPLCHLSLPPFQFHSVNSSNAFIPHTHIYLPLCFLKNIHSIFHFTYSTH